MFNGLIRNRSTEKDIRDWLDQHGYLGDSVTFEELELHAIERPGWVQVFRFTVRAKPRRKSGAEIESANDSESILLHGAFRGDERLRSDQKFQIRLFDDQDEQQQQLEQWASDLIRQEKASGVGLLVLIGVIVVLVIMVSIVLKLLA